MGVGGAAVLCFFGWSNVLLLKDEDLCMVFEDDFNSFDTSKWNRDVQLSGFGNGEFQMTTALDQNLFVQNGELFIMPTLTSDVVGKSAILDGGKYTLDGCTNQVRSCSELLDFG